GEGATLRFEQPSASSRVLNRVVGSDPSAILGRLEANGIVYIVNPAGVTFGPNSVVDVAGLIAAAGRLSTDDFTSGIDRFVDVTGSVRSEGRIDASRFVHLVGRGVMNTGTIVVEGGVVSLTAGERVYVREGERGLLVSTDRSTAEPPLGGAVVQSGEIAATDVFVTAGDLYSIALGGSVRARRGCDGGRVSVLGGGDVSLDGTIDASAAEAGTGGHVDVVGRRLSTRGATIDVRGARGGGVVRLGGGERGMPIGDEIGRTSVRVFIDPATEILASATEQGPGGRVVIWSGERTDFRGSIESRGGTTIGDGGFVEVSSAGALGFDGHVDTTASRGVMGRLLLDPNRIEIVSGGALGSGDVDEFADPGSDPSVSRIDPATLDAVGGDVTLEATDSIVFTDALSLSTDGASVTARAGGSIQVDAPITTRGGTLTLIANDGASGSATGSGSVGVSATLATDGGGVGGGDVVLIVDGGSGVVVLGADVRSSGGITFAAPVQLGGERSVEAMGTVTFASSLDGGGRLFVRAPSGETIFASTVGSTTLRDALVTDAGGGTRFAGNVRVGSGGIDIRDAIRLDADVTLATLDGGPIRLGSTVDSSGAPRSLVLLTLDAAGTAIDPEGIIRLGGDIGASSALASLSIQAETGIDPRSVPAAVATVIGEGSLRLVAIGDISIGAGEKTTVLGDFEVSSAVGTVTVGDIVALGSLEVSATEIHVRRRAPAFVYDPTGRLFLDGGVEWIAGVSILTNVAPVAIGVGASP
ncbi:MAG: filamentous hemagglutinin N-terminal domain-containing protein, partial [Planctomycetes bacterium]|nr:filamentous hemagglutinin N-terminal domain-containing protein [Planctomycetota bacterium]